MKLIEQHKLQSPSAGYSSSEVPNCAYLTAYGCLFSAVWDSKNRWVCHRKLTQIKQGRCGSRDKLRCGYVLGRVFRTMWNQRFQISAIYLSTLLRLVAIRLKYFRLFMNKNRFWSDNNALSPSSIAHLHWNNTYWTYYRHLSALSILWTRFLLVKLTLAGFQAARFFLA